MEERVIYVERPRKRDGYVIWMFILTTILLGLGGTLYFGRAPLARLLAQFQAASAPVPTAYVPRLATPMPTLPPVQEEAPPVVVPVTQEGSKPNRHPLPTMAPVVVIEAPPAEQSVSVGGSLDIGVGGISAEGHVDVVSPANEGARVQSAPGPATQEGSKPNRRRKP